MPAQMKRPAHMASAQLLLPWADEMGELSAQDCRKSSFMTGWNAL